MQIFLKFSLSSIYSPEFQILILTVYLIEKKNVIYILTITFKWAK